MFQRKFGEVLVRNCEAVMFPAQCAPPMAETLKKAPSNLFSTKREERAEQTDDVTRALPHAVGPEKSLLSTMLQDPQEYIGLSVEEKLTASHFYLPGHSTLSVC